MMKIITFIQSENGKINSVSLEALQASQTIAKLNNGSVSAVIFEENIPEILKNYELDEILQLTDTNLYSFNPLYYVKAMEEIISAENPNIITFGHTYETRDWVPRLSARLDLPFISDCIGINTDTNLSFIRSIYQGKINSDVSVKDGNFIVSFQSGAFKVDEINEGTPSIRNMQIDLSKVETIISQDTKFQETQSAVDLTQAKVIISVGRGIGKEENLSIARDLASCLNGELASSRPVVDSGWLESYHQVGSSGQNVSPQLYLALGISGAIQHVVGMKSSKNILVINKDANAPIFEIADYGIVGDLFEIVPKLIEKIKNN